MRNLAGVPGGKPLSVYFTAKREEKSKGINCAALPRNKSPCTIPPHCARAGLNWDTLNTFLTMIHYQADSAGCPVSAGMLDSWVVKYKAGGASKGGGSNQ